MDVSGMLAWAVLALLVSGSGYATPIPDSVEIDDNCVSNCVSTTRYQNNLLVVARNREGEIFKTLSLELPSGAKRVFGSARGGYGGRDFRIGRPDAQMLSEVPVGSLCGGIPGVCTETALIRYETPTQLVIYTFTYVFNNGDLVEVRVDETRVARSKLN